MNLLRRLLFILPAVAALLGAQSTGPALLAGFGYTLPQTAVSAAPGQILMVSVYGIRSINPPLTGPLATPTGLPPTDVGGISVTLSQQAQPQQTPVGIFGIQQSTCGNSSASTCKPVSTLTLSIPFELQTPADGSNVATLRIADQGTALGDIPLRPVSDSIHVLSSCDQMPIVAGVLSEPHGSGCTPVVQHGDGRLVTDTAPARLGETLIAWVYGLGAIDPTATDQFHRPFPKQTVTLSFDAHPNAPAIRPLPSSDATHPIFSILAAPQGLYQLNFVLPSNLPGPFAACDDFQVQSNLTITLSGAKSMDAAPICVTP